MAFNMCQRSAASSNMISLVQSRTESLVKDYGTGLNESVNISIKGLVCIGSSVATSDISSPF